jgi:GDP-mannose 6-dehydrogenase
MNISIFGLGYVGSVGVACLAQLGHKVVGVDVNEAKVRFINQGKSPIVENDLDSLLLEQHKKGSIRAVTSAVEAVQQTDVSFICVGTPSTGEGHLNLEGIFRVSREIAKGLREKKGFHVIAIRSTVLPGTNAKVADILQQDSGKIQDRDFAVVSNPEFLREGTAIKDYYDPPLTLIGSSSDGAIELMKEVYSGIDAPFVTTDIQVAEMIKYVNNSFHALKVSFANEIGAICKKLGIDSHELMRIFCMDTRLNISPYYLKPGFAYGGSCLPKDLKALCTLAHDLYVKCPIIESIDASNELLKEMTTKKIISFEKQKIGFLGLSFKEGTDDLRNSPIVDVLEKLLGKGFDVRIYDRNVHFSQLMGANREFILEKIPLISRFITNDMQEVINHADLVVVVNKDEEFKKVLTDIAPHKIVFDLVRISANGTSKDSNYEGIAWR